MSFIMCVRNRDPLAECQVRRLVEATDSTRYSFVSINELDEFLAALRVHGSPARLRRTTPDPSRTQIIREDWFHAILRPWMISRKSSKSKDRQLMMEADPKRGTPCTPPQDRSVLDWLY